MNKKTFYGYRKFTPELFVSLYGVDGDINTTHWGPGSRDVYIIQFVTKGKGYFNNQEVHAGQGFLIIPDSIIEYHADRSDPWEYFWMDFTGTNVKEILRDINLNYKKNSVFNYDFKDWLIDFIEKLNTYEKENKSRANGNACFYMIYSLMQNKNEDEKPVDKATTHIDLAIIYMKNHFHKNIKPSDVAKFVGINVRHLSRIMKEKMGITPQDYLTDLRITKAKELLLNTDFSIYQISYSTGYNDEFFFSTFFKKKVGLSPLQFRKQKMLNR